VLGSNDAFACWASCALYHLCKIIVVAYAQSLFKDWFRVFGHSCYEDELAADAVVLLDVIMLVIDTFAKPVGVQPAPTAKRLLVAAPTVA
jgi:hypothetical protein